MTTLITFDVDGTLIKSAAEQSNELHKEAFSAAFREVFGLESDIDRVKHHGGTDPLILVKVLAECHGVAREDAMAKLEDMKKSMVEHYMAHKEKAGNGLMILPGIKELLAALKEKPNVQFGLVTGNLEPIAWSKMQALGIKDLFSEPNFGGFGSDFCSGNYEEMHHDRAELIRIAASKVDGPIATRFHVGDAPADVMAAKQAGAVAVGVTTGIFDADALRSQVPETVLVEDFSDLQQALATFGLQ